MAEGSAQIRILPSVDRVLKTDQAMGWLECHPRRLVVKAIREAIEEKRAVFMAASPALPASTPEEVLTEVLALAAAGLKRLAAYRLRPVINATGIVVHTNLGRSPLCASALQNVVKVAVGYSNLEYDLSAGKRGKRFVHVVDQIKDLTGAEDAMVVNNNASAVLICLTAHACGKEVLVSRGELVEIGGSFRIPDILAAGGALLKEVGTTNKTHPGDYERAITANCAMVLKVHQSNFRVTGFTGDVPIDELSALAHSHGIPVMFDLGSGCLIDLKPLGIHVEPTVQEVIRSGADLVTFSGDKLLGGPQCGLIAGKARYVESLRKHPLSRAMRVDKFTLAALEATLMEYADEDGAKKNVPTLKMLFQEAGDIKKRAAQIASGLSRLGSDFDIILVEEVSQAGGGSLPGVELPTFAVSVIVGGMSAVTLQSALRATTPPVIGRIKEDRLLLDPRTIADDEVSPLIGAFNKVLSGRL
ncbi:MAG: L-seryl-tRNA(Sec) selenium transferase [Nitrospirae bacterium]|nr:L-seryl-tRNA(Sec) selenium transferase [Nitrospirota bacterium]